MRTSTLKWVLGLCAGSILLAATAAKATPEPWDTNPVLTIEQQLALTNRVVIVLSPKAIAVWEPYTNRVTYPVPAATKPIPVARKVTDL